MDFDESRSEGEIGIDLLIPGEGLVKNFERSFNDRAIFVLIDVAGMNDPITCASLRAGTVTLHTLSIFGHFVRWTSSDASAVVFQKMFGAMLDTRSAICKLSIGVRLP